MVLHSSRFGPERAGCGVTLPRLASTCGRERSTRSAADSGQVKPRSGLIQDHWRRDRPDSGVVAVHEITRSSNRTGAWAWPEIDLAHRSMVAGRGALHLARGHREAFGDDGPPMAQCL